MEYRLRAAAELKEKISGQARKPFAMKNLLLKKQITIKPTSTPAKIIAIAIMLMKTGRGAPQRTRMPVKTEAEEQIAVEVIVGMGKAIELAYKNIEKYNKKLIELREYCIEELQRKIGKIRSKKRKKHI